MPLEGDGQGPDGHGDSYTFWVVRFLTPEEPLEQLQSTAATTWRERGWEVTEESVFGGKLYTAMTPEGYRIGLNAESADMLSVTVTSAAYWGNFNALLRDIAARRDAEDEKKTPGTQFERDPKTKQAALEPGEYRPFPAWDAVPAA
ncbi:MAG: hypothetical protein LBE25_10030 [Arthrobacter sp.]|jgi:hypothetical protein|nr:hypothetical protein [Arthrobacter sp.]